MIILFDIKNNNLVIENIHDAIDKIYYLEMKIPTVNEVKETKNKKIKEYFDQFKAIEDGIKNIKTELSKSSDKIPLYDVYSENIYLINKNNVYDRVTNNYYRFPTQELYNKLVKRFNKIKNLNENDPIKQRKKEKLSLMIDFLKSFDLDELYKTYMMTFYLYSDEVGKNISVCKRPSFMPHFTHLKPYYTNNDVINIALNMGISQQKINDFQKKGNNNDILCDIISENDISAETLLEHQQYMIKNDRVGLVQYYTLQGSYFMNQYLRNMTLYNERNSYLESLITPMWKLINNAPEFDKDYTFYRFVNSDNHIRNVDIGEIYTENGFISTTRDPFYRSDLYKFGFILIKIKVPKNVRGVALCVETLSHFPDEQEIIFSPLSMLRLEKRDDKCEYYHTDNKFSSQIKTRYEFTYIGKRDITYIDRPLMPSNEVIVDFVKLDEIDTITLEEKIRYFINRHINKLYQFKTKIGENIYTILAERYDSTGAYKKFFAVTIQNGFLLYTLVNNYVLFMIEIGEMPNTNEKYIHVNYYVKYSTLSKEEYYSDDEFVRFISSIGYYFKIDKIILWADFKTCDKQLQQNQNQNQKQNQNQNQTKQVGGKSQFNGICKPQIMQNLLNNTATSTTIQRGFSETKKLIKSEKIPVIEDIQDQDQHKTSISNSLYEDIGGGIYCVDFYDYLNSKKKRYQTISSMELQPKFSYHQLDRLRNINPEKILDKSDLDEIYQIYDKIFKPQFVNSNTVAEFYLWMIKHKCYLIETLIEKMIRIFRIDNPFETFYYVIDAYAYLYNRRFIDSYPSPVGNVATVHMKEIIPQNKYRLS